ncbi:MAG: response regulator [Pirellulaceae bacterium]|nr:response regulator [Pirellulaceae bacterium]
MVLQTFRSLVVDDESISRQTVGFALIQEGFSCVYAADGEEALRRLAVEQFDLVVTDLRMPNKNGHALAVQLLKEEKRPFIVVHSSVDDPRLTKDLLLRGVDDIVYKPTNYAAFAAKMKSLVERHREVVRPDTEKNVPQPVANDLAEKPATEKTASAMVSCPASPTNRESVEERRSDMTILASQETIAEQVCLLATQLETSPEELIAMISQDAILTAEVLHVANSATYIGNRFHSNDLRESVLRLGYRKIGEIAQNLHASKLPLSDQ